MPLTGIQKLERLFGSFSLNTPLLAARDMHRCVEGFELFLAEGGMVSGSQRVDLAGTNEKRIWFRNVGFPTSLVEYLAEPQAIIGLTLPGKICTVRAGNEMGSSSVETIPKHRIRYD